MNNNTKKPGQRPVEEKTSDVRDFLKSRDSGSGLLDFPRLVVNYAQKHKIRLRWSSNQTVTQAGGYDPSGWRIFYREYLTKDPEFSKNDTIDDVEFKFGGHSEPVYRRGDLILTFMMEEEWQQAQANNRQRAILKSRSAKEARQFEGLGKGISVKEIDADS